MATTTNYGWTTPDDTALVKDGASAIRTLGSSVDTTTKNLNPETTLGDLSFRSSTSNVNTRIGIGSSGQFLSVVGGVPAWATATDQTPLTTKGDIFTFSTVDARLAVGTNGQVLTADSSEATGLKFATPASGGKVLQVVSATSSTTTSSSTNSFVDITDVTATITPSAATSKILVLVSLDWRKTSGSASTAADFKLLRASTAIVNSQDWTLTEAAEFATSCWSINYYDSPATTSATTYKMQVGSRNSTAAIQVGFLSANSQQSITLLEIGA